MNNPWIKTFMAFHKVLFQIAGARLGWRAGKHQFLLLHNVGRNSGRNHTTPLSYFKEGDKYILVASNWGRSDHPQWFLNLVDNPKTVIEIGSEPIPVVASRAWGNVRERLWEMVTHKNKQYLKYQAVVSRQIPIVLLTPEQEFSLD